MKMDFPSNMIVVVIANYLLLVTNVDGVVRKTFTYPSVNGSELQMSFPWTENGDCLYDNTRDLTTCMKNHPYSLITSTIYNEPENIKYVSVNCLKQNIYASHPQKCVCKDKTMAAHPHKGTQKDSYSFCYLDAIYRDMFTPLSSLEVLDLSFNHLFRVPPNCFDDLRKLRLLALSGNQFARFFNGLLCNVTSLEVLLLQETPIERFPENLFKCGEHFQSNIKSFDLSKSQISDIKSGDFDNLGNVRFLDLSYNKLTLLPDMPFKGLSSLEVLDLSGNKFKSINASMFQGVQNLTHLRFRQNNLSSLNCSSLKSCSSLIVLDLSHGFISALNDNACKLDSLRHIDLSWNKIENIPSHFFHNETIIQSINLSHNKINQVRVTSFHHMTGLMSLNFSNNKFSELDETFPQTFKHLWKLNILDFSNNDINWIANGTFQSLKSLTKLYLTANTLEMFYDGIFKGLTSVSEIYCSNNKIFHIESDTFADLLLLEVLNLSNNLLASNIISLPHSLRIINLSNNSISSLQMFSGLPQLQELYLSNNRIEFLSNKNFRSLPNLTVLDLRQNSLNIITDVFFSLLPQVIDVDLSYNNLSLNLSARLFKGSDKINSLNLEHNKISLVNKMFDTGDLPYLQVLDLSFNNIAEIMSLGDKTQQNALKVLNLESCGIKKIGNDAFIMLKKLEYVNLMTNKISFVPRFNARNGAKFYFKYNPLICSCGMSWLIERWLDTGLGQKISCFDYDLNTCKVYPKMEVLKIRSLSKSQFLCPVTQCHSFCECYQQADESSVYLTICRGNLTKIPSYLPTETKMLYLDGNNLDSINKLGSNNFETTSLFLNNSVIASLGNDVFKEFHKVVVIVLSRNKLKSLSSGIFQNLLSLKEIDLSHNFLTDLPAGIFQVMPALQNIDISYNQITHILQPTIKELDNLQIFRWIRLSGNPYVCACPNYDFRLWMDRSYNRVYDRKEVLCDVDKDIRHVEIGVFECHSTFSGTLKSSVIGICVLVSLVLILGLFLYCRNEVGAVCYTRYLPYFFWIRVKPKPDYSLCIYDAVILYDTADTKCSWWVENTLVPKLQDSKRKFKLYVPQPGLESRDRTLYNIQRSHSTISLVTASFQQNSFALECFKHSASTASSNTNNHHVILITWGFIDRKNINVTLKNYLNTASELGITCSFFWDKLIQKLPETLSRKDQRVTVQGEVNPTFNYDENTL